MRSWARLLLCGGAGIIAGNGAAVWSVRAGALGMQQTIGPWVTGRDFGSAQASGYTRAVVALRGLLALPAHEARYYTAATDDAGRPLDGKCHYRLAGGAVPAKWWSVTLYDPAGYLVPNSANVYSIGSASLPSAETTDWSIEVAPGRQLGRWLPSGDADRFQLTLRAYLPDDGGKGDLTRVQLPRIERRGCA